MVSLVSLPELKVRTVALFVIPLDFKNGRFLMEWKDTAKLPWGILLLFGGGLSLANALAETGLIDLIGAQFKGLDNVGLLVILGLTAVSLFLTEIMSNVALVTIFLCRFEETVSVNLSCSEQ